jgi:hypothetical protein
MDKFKCCICLPVFNSEFGLPYVLKTVKVLEKEFKEIRVLFFYEHSSDKSLSIINNFIIQNPSIVELYINNNKKSVIRTENIAFARNGMIHTIKSDYSDYEYFIMMDTNHYSCVGNIHIETLKEVFLPTKIDQWDSVSFDREDGYYDHWALSYGNFPYSFFHFENWKVAVAKLREEFGPFLENRKKNNPEDFIPVYSAFNGFAIYKTNKFLNCTYSADIDITLFDAPLLYKQIEKTGCRIIHHFKEDCEHRHFHFESIKKNNSKIMIYPKSIFQKFVKE